MGANLDPKLRREVIELLRQGKNIGAVKHIRECLGVGLAEGKTLMEEVLESGDWMASK